MCISENIFRERVSTHNAIWKRNDVVTDKYGVNVTKASDRFCTYFIFNIKYSYEQFFQYILYASFI